MADGSPARPAPTTTLRDAVEDVHLRALTAKLYVERLVAAGLIHDEALADALATLEQCARALDAVTERTAERGRVQRESGGDA